MTFVAELEPTAVWRHFDAILKIPRGSKNEEGMRRYVTGVAAAKGLTVRRDGVGNLVVVKPASRGREGAAPTVLQSHLDMVNEKNSDVDHDFTRDPIVPHRDGDYVKATGTTLGADNGIGVAIMLALLDDEELPHGPLEMLFTIDEETGLTGALGFDASLLSGRRLLNLDSEEDDTVTVGCAGGGDSVLTLPLDNAPAPSGAVALRLRLSGLRGGHSGTDIHLQRGNAVKLLARMLRAAGERVPLVLAELAGGDKRNAIPREAEAVVLMAGERRGELVALLEEEAAAIRDELGPVEPDLRFDSAPAPAPAQAWTAASTARALALIDALPHGVLAMSHEVPGLVETSNNVAAVRAGGGGLEIATSSRSPVASAFAAIRQRLRSFAALAGAEIVETDAYPGWKPNFASPLLALVRRVHREVVGRDPEVQVIHAGLECGILGEKVPGMDMISFGPQIEAAHSPDERVRIASVAAFYRLLTATLTALAESGQTGEPGEPTGADGSAAAGARP